MLLEVVGEFFATVEKDPLHNHSNYCPNKVAILAEWNLPLVFVSSKTIHTLEWLCGEGREGIETSKKDRELEMAQ